VLLDQPAPARLAGRLRPLLTSLLDKEPARRPSYDTIHAMLVDASPASNLAASHAAADVPAAEPTVTAVGARPTRAQLHVTQHSCLHITHRSGGRPRVGRRPPAGRRSSTIRQRKAMASA
jgi:hypothetical protein